MPAVHDADPGHPANIDPANATAAEIEEELEFRRLDDPPLQMHFDGRCQRCADKNRRRRAAGLEEEREQFHDGEEVTFGAHYVGITDVVRAPPGFWRVGGAICADHPQIPIEEYAGERWHQVLGAANLDYVADEWRLTNVTIDAISRAGEGPEVSPVTERMRAIGADPDEKDHARRTAAPIDEPEPGWPAEEREWLDELLDEHGPLPEIPPHGPDGL